MESVKYTWKTISDFAHAHRSAASHPSGEPSQEEIDHTVDLALSQMAKDEDDKLETGCRFSQTYVIQCVPL